MSITDLVGILADAYSSDSISSAEIALLYLSDASAERSAYMAAAFLGSSNQRIFRQRSPLADMPSDCFPPSDSTCGEQMRAVSRHARALLVALAQLDRRLSRDDVHSATVLRLGLFLSAHAIAFLLLAVLVVPCVAFDWCFTSSRVRYNYFRTGVVFFLFSHVHIFCFSCSSQL